MCPPVATIPWARTVSRRIVTRTRSGPSGFSPMGPSWPVTGRGRRAAFADVLALRSQSLDSYAGKLLRMKRDGSAPTAPLVANPFHDGTNSIRSKVWAYGLRNPFRFGVQPDHGPAVYRGCRVGDLGARRERCARRELWLALFRGQYPATDLPSHLSGGCQAVPASAVTMPLYTYGRAVGSTVIGGTFFTGTQYPAQYAGNFFFADYTQGWMKRIVFDGSGTVQSVLDFASNMLDVNRTGGPVAIELGPDGLLYYIVFTTGEIARIRRHSGTGSNFPPPCQSRRHAAQWLCGAQCQLLQRRIVRPGRRRADLSCGILGMAGPPVAEPVSYL